MKALKIGGEIVRLEDLDDDIKTLQKAVGGRVETIGLKERAVMIVNVEAEQKGLAYNTLASLIAESCVYGPAFIVGDEYLDDGFTDVPESYMDLLNLMEV